MVNAGILLGHKISERGIEVDRAKVEATEKMPYPRDVKGICSILGHAGVGGFHVARTRGTTLRTQRIRMQGVLRVRSRVRRNTAMEDSTRRRSHHMTESDTDPYPGSGPSW
jgi:hypothetical protein